MTSSMTSITDLCQFQCLFEYFAAANKNGAANKKIHKRNYWLEFCSMASPLER